MSTRKRPRSSSRNRSPDTSSSPLDDAELNEFSDEELDHLFSPSSSTSSDRFGRIATATGIGMMLVLALYLIAEFTTMGFLGSTLGISMVGVMVAIIGFGVFSGRKEKKRASTSSSKSSGSSSASIEEKVQAKLREAREALNAEDRSTSSPSNGLRRSAQKKLFGVCAGLGEYFGIDVTLVRAVFLIGLVLSGGQMMLVYFGLAYIMPKPDDA